MRSDVPSEVFYKGRPGDLRLGEWVRPVSSLSAKQERVEVVLVGYPDDQGVKQNRGRPGAAEGPVSIRRHLYKMTVPADGHWAKGFALFDLGDALVSKRLSETHANAAKLAAAAAANSRVVVALGGGHDFAASTFEGVSSTLPKARWGLLNVDPHLDTREMEGPDTHSGNPFRKLLESKRLVGSRFVQFGARLNRNTQSSWKYCVDQKVTLLPLEKLRTQKKAVTEVFSTELAKLLKRCDAAGLTIDLDACFEAEGTSAAPVLGFSAMELCAFAAAAGKNPKVKYLEIAEVAPGLDVNERCSRIAAEICYAFFDAKSINSKNV